MLANAQAEFSRSPRLRLAVALLAGVLLWNLALGLRAAAQRAQADWQSARTATSRAATDAASTEWPARVVQARALKAQLQSALWRQPTLGLAQVRLQDWLRGEFELVGLQPRFIGPVVTGGSVSGVAPTEGQSNVVPIRVRFEADFDGAKLDQLLARLHAASPKVYVTQLAVRPESTQRFDGVIVAYFVNPEGAQ